MLEIFALKIAVVGFVWSGILVQPGELFDWVPRVICRMTNNEKIHKVTFACEKCFSGQLAFWSYLMIHFEDYDLSTHIYFTFLTMFFVALLTKLWKKL